MSIVTKKLTIWNTNSRVRRTKKIRLMLLSNIMVCGDKKIEIKNQGAIWVVLH